MALANYATHSLPLSATCSIKSSSTINAPASLWAAEIWHCRESHVTRPETTRAPPPTLRAMATPTLWSSKWCVSTQSTLNKRIANTLWDFRDLSAFNYAWKRRCAQYLFSVQSRFYGARVGLSTKETYGFASRCVCATFKVAASLVSHVSIYMARMAS